MTTYRRDFLKLGLGACLLPLLGSSRAQALVSEHLYAFGTLVDVSVVAHDVPRAHQAIAEVCRMFVHQNKEWHAWKPGALHTLNQALAAGRSQRVDADLLGLLREARAFAELSGGLFNPAIGRLVGRWGFHADLPPTGRPPSARELADLIAQPPSLHDLVIEGDQVFSRHPLLQIDLGGYAKGVALDRALDHLAAAGCGDALVNLGGNLPVSGLHGVRPWRIGVRHPLLPGRTLARLEAGGRLAVVTSGTYERYRVHEGRRYAHILDPRSGTPAQGVVSATVIHPNAALADAAATALVVAGPRAWVEVARAMGVEEVLIVTADGEVHMTRPMAARTRLILPPPAVRLVAL